jgi:hypothetical protein
MRDRQIFWIIPALVFSAAVWSDRSTAQQAPPPPGQSKDLSADCVKTSTSPEIKSAKDIEKLSSFLRERGEKTTRCADAIKDRIKDLLKGEQPWSYANEQIGGLIKLANDLLYSIEGPNGVREQVALLIAKVDSDAKRVKDHITDKADQERVKGDLLNASQRMKESLNQVDGAAKQLKEKAYDLEKKRPELAFEWQLENYKAIASAVSNLADSIKSQADVLGKAVPTNLGKAQP